MQVAALLIVDVTDQHLYLDGKQANKAELKWQWWPTAY